MSFPGWVSKNGSIHATCVRVALAGLLAVASLPAQGTDIFRAATPDVEAKLRARITAFFEAQQQGKVRQAEKFVSEDSIDAFLERDHTRYPKFDIHDIHWEGEGFKEAMVTMIVPFDMVTALGIIPSVPRPIIDHWHLEDNEWFWYVPKVDPCAPIKSVVGTDIIPECKDGKPVGRTADPEKELLNMISAGVSKVKIEDLQERVTADKSQVQINPKTGGEQSLTITNSFDGPVTLHLLGASMKGLNTGFDGGAADDPNRITVEAKKTATLRLRYVAQESNPPDRLGMQVQVDPLNVTLPVDILFTAQ